ncbi:MAG TPA: hypothetical protein VH087_12255 [Thermoanaerobaculia bacterium]|jgi:hypothetical protein|nr:hypothetical protein [Thermoanaerobaculia bacterium]
MKRISTLAVAALLAVSMSAFADNTKTTDTKSCDKMTAAECQKKDPNCTKANCKGGDNHSCPKHDAANSCSKTSDKKS